MEGARITRMRAPFCDASGSFIVSVCGCAGQALSARKPASAGDATTLRTRGKMITCLSR